MPDSYRVRLTDDWLPFPQPLLDRLGWLEGDELELELSGDCLIVSRTGRAAIRPEVKPLRKAKEL